MTSFQTCNIEPFRYQATPQPDGTQGASGSQINEQSLEDYLTRLRDAICSDLESLTVGTTQPSPPEGSVQFNDADAFGGESAFVYDKTTNQLTPGNSQLLIEAGAPATPAAGRVVSFASGRMAITLPAWLNEDGTLNFVQTSFGKRHIFEATQWARASAAGTVDVQWRGGGTFAGAGASTTQPARATTNIHTQIPGVTRITSATANSSQAAYYGQYLFASPAHGYLLSMRFAVNATPATLKMLFGMTATTAAPLGTNTPSASLNFIGIGCDDGETTLRILNNDGSGTCTITDLGVNFPSRDTATAYDVFIYLHPGGGSFDYFVVNLGTGDTASGTISSNLPSLSVFQCPFLWMSNGAAAGGVAAQLDFARVYMEVFDGV